MSFRLKAIIAIGLMQSALLLMLIYNALGVIKSANQAEIQQQGHLSAILVANSVDVTNPRQSILLLKQSLEEHQISHIESVQVFQADKRLYAAERNSLGEFALVEQPVRIDNLVPIEAQSNNGSGVAIKVMVNTDEFDHSVNGVAIKYSALMLLVIVLISILSWYQGLNLIKHVFNIQRASKQVLEGDTGVQVNEPGTQDITDTTNAFNEMLQFLDQQRHDLQGANVRLNTILDSAADGFVIIDTSGVITEVNKAVSSLFGYQKEELIDQNVSILMPMADRFMHDGYIQDYLKGGDAKIVGLGGGRALKAQHKEGHLFPIELSISKMEIDGDVLFLGFIKDMSELKKEQASAARTQSIHLATLEASHDALITINIAGRVEEFNAAAVKLFGYEREEALGELLEDLIIPEGFHKAHKNGMDHHRKTGEGPVLNNRIEVPAHNKAGDEFPVELRVIPIQLDDEMYYTAFLRNISEQKSKEEELRQAKEQAEEGSKAKSRFLATMSHEIRSPLNAVLGSVDLLLDSSLEKGQRMYARTAKEAGSVLLSTINDILDFSKIEAGQMVLEPKEFEPDELVAQVLQILSHKAHDKGVHLASYINRNVPQKLVGDAQRIRQVVQNLVDNAIKFSTEGCISVEVWIPNRDNDKVQLCCRVTDQGIGIGDASQEKLFREFSQVHDTHTTSYAGTGLGLAICSELARMMGGNLVVESKLGEGSQFTLSVLLDESSQASNHNVRLPEHPRVLLIHPDETLCKLIKKQYSQYGVETKYEHHVSDIFNSKIVRGRFDLIMLDDACLLSAKEKDVSILHSDYLFETGYIAALATGVNNDAQSLIEKLGIEESVSKPLSRAMLLSLISGATAENKHEKPLEKVASLPQGCRLLLAEDSPANQMVAGTMLTNEGAVMTYANNGVEAVELALSQDFDLILMDIRMPEMDGLEACQKILAHKPDQIILAMTANVFSEEIAACKAVGMLDCIGKPVNKSDLISGVSHWLGQVKQASSMGMGMQIELTHDKPQVENKDKVTAEISEQSTELSAPKVSTDTDTDELFTEVMLDEAVFDELLSAVGEASLAKMMQVFYHETIMRVNTLKALTPQGSRHDIETEVHTIKSSAGSFGAKTLADVAVRLEAASRTEDEPLDALFNEMFAVAEQSLNLIQQRFNITQKSE
ncbi:PAS domain S-box protein [Shewanella sp. MMG014]|uniref:hybrid sensor histidine kinase/response regulator n=1 Tax=Shewanella sp. MMG014 TaxID=2822691 RepID=UPI001B399AEB|nr:PAS domain S-box protein [Shewanella sp. MMG014]MBQ4888449.1 PAS domain S-box protein [Shewanella sp. MMG014]